MTAILTMLAGFSGGINGEEPDSSLIADANGDLFGTTSAEGAFFGGTVFEIAKTAGGYASAPITLASFDVTSGATPLAGLIADAQGDLFGTASGGGASNVGTVFEIAKTAGGYASTPTSLAGDGSFPHGAVPTGGLIADANGDLFGTTNGGGGNGDGTVFEIKKTAGGYASTPTTLVSFNGADGALPQGSLIADAKGDLFGATHRGGADDAGTIPSWPVLMAPMAATRSPDSLPTSTAIYSGRPQAAAQASPSTAVLCSRSPTAALFP